MFFILYFVTFLFHSSSCLKASEGCNKPFNSQEGSFQEVYVETVNDAALGPVEREYIVQFPPGILNQ